jgi:hypothetical protein
MIDAEYFRRQAAKLQKLAESIRDPARAQSFSAMAADFLARADELQRAEAVRVFAPKDGSPDGEMDRD